MCVTVGFWLSSLFFMYGTRSSLVELMCVMVGFSLSFCGNELCICIVSIYRSLYLYLSIYVSIYYSYFLCTCITMWYVGTIIIIVKWEETWAGLIYFKFEKWVFHIWKIRKERDPSTNLVWHHIWERCWINNGCRRHTITINSKLKAERERLLFNGSKKN
jgi:hypothetical protein